MSLHYLYTILLHYTVYSRRLIDLNFMLRPPYDVTQIDRESKFYAEIYVCP